MRFPNWLHHVIISSTVLSIHHHIYFCIFTGKAAGVELNEKQLIGKVNWFTSTHIIVAVWHIKRALTTRNRSTSVWEKSLKHWLICFLLVYAWEKQRHSRQIELKMVFISSAILGAATGTGKDPLIKSNLNFIIYALFILILKDWHFWLPWWLLFTGIMCIAAKVRNGKNLTGLRRNVTQGKFNCRQVKENFLGEDGHLLLISESKCNRKRTFMVWNFLTVNSRRKLDVERSCAQQVVVLL